MVRIKDQLLFQRVIKNVDRPEKEYAGMFGGGQRFDHVRPNPAPSTGNLKRSGLRIADDHESQGLGQLSSTAT
jgi:hypothetical protein